MPRIVQTKGSTLCWLVFFLFSVLPVLLLDTLGNDRVRIPTIEWVPPTAPNDTHYSARMDLIAIIREKVNNHSAWLKGNCPTGRFKLRVHDFLNHATISNLTQPKEESDFDGPMLDLTGLRCRNFNLQSGLISGAYFNNADLEAVNFSDSELSRVAFHNSDLSNIEITNAKLEALSFKDTTLTAIRLVDTQINEFFISSSILKACTAESVIINRGGAMDCELSNFYFDSVTATNMRFLRSNLAGFSIRDLAAHEVIIAESQLRELEIGKSLLVDSGFYASTVKDAKLHATDLEEAQISESHFAMVSWTDSLLTNIAVFDSEFANSTFARSQISKGGLARNGASNIHMDRVTLGGLFLEDLDITQLGLDGAELRELQLVDSSIFGSTVLRSTIDSVSAVGSRLANLSITGSSVINSTITDSTITNTALRQADLINFVSMKCDLGQLVANDGQLQSVRFIESNLSNVTLYPVGIFELQFLGRFPDLADLDEEIDFSDENFAEMFREYEQRDLVERPIDPDAIHGDSLRDPAHRSYSIQDLQLHCHEIDGLTFNSILIQDIEIWTRNSSEIFFFYAPIHRGQFSFNSVSNVSFFSSYLRDVDFSFQETQDLSFTHTTLEDIKFPTGEFEAVSFRGAAFLPPIIFDMSLIDRMSLSTLADAKGLANLRYLESEVGLVGIRQGFKALGLTLQERKIHFAINHERKQRFRNTPGLEAKSEFLWYEIIELLTGYGLHPVRSLLLMLKLIGLMSIVYFFPIIYGRDYQSGKSIPSGIWLHQAEDCSVHLNQFHKDIPTPIKKLFIPEGLSVSDRRRALIINLLIALFHALYFSASVTFRIGWRDLSIGNWITRIDPRGVVLKSTGWVRTVSGIQSVIGVFLFGLFLWSYFTLPLE